MTSIDLAGEAAFWTLNIRRRGQTAPKVESGAFRLSGWTRRLAQRAGLVEGRAEQRSGPSGAAGTRAAAPEPTWPGGRSGRRDRRGGCRRWSAHLRPGRSRPTGCPDLFGTAHKNRTGDDLAGYWLSGHHWLTGDFGASTAILGATPDDRTACHETQRGHHGRARSEFLVDRPSSGDPACGTHPDRPRGDQVLAGAHRREHLTTRPAGRPEPAVRRPGSSSSSDVDRDVRSVTRCLAEI